MGVGKRIFFGARSNGARSKTFRRDLLNIQTFRIHQFINHFPVENRI